MSSRHYTTGEHGQALKKGSEFIAANLAECVADKLESQRTGIVPVGKFLYARVIYNRAYARQGNAMADSEVSRQVMQAYLDRADDAAMLDWVIVNRNMRVQGRGASGWFVMDCNNGLTFYVDGAPTYRDAIRAAMAKQAAAKVV